MDDVKKVLEVEQMKRLLREQRNSAVEGNLLTDIESYTRNPLLSEHQKFSERFIALVLHAMKMRSLSMESLAKKMNKRIGYVQAIIEGRANLEIEEMISILMFCGLRFKVSLEELSPEKKQAVNDWVNPGSIHF